MSDHTILILPSPLWIVADDTLGELEWALRSQPLPHLAIGMGLGEELRSATKPVTDYDLGKILNMELASFNYGYWPGQAPITYADITRSNFVEYGEPGRSRQAVSEAAIEHLRRMHRISLSGVLGNSGYSGSHEVVKALHRHIDALKQELKF